MNHRTLSFILLCGLAMIVGCSVTVGTGGGHGRTPKHPCPHEDVTMSEIDAVSQLSFDSSMLNAYQDIASRLQLSAPAQVYLVQRSLDELSFESSKNAVIMKLIENPDFLEEGKRAIIDNLNAFSYESTKQSILSALNLRGPVPSARQTHERLEMETTVEVEAGYGTNL